MTTPIRHFLVKRSEISTLKLFVEFYQPESLELLRQLRDGVYHARPLSKVSPRIFDDPFGSDRKIDMYQSSGVPYMRVKDVLPEGIDQREPESVQEETRFLKSVADMRGSRFDVAFNMGFHKFDPYFDLVTPIKTVADFPKESYDPFKFPNISFKYIDTSSINILTGEVEGTTEILGAEAPSRARQVVHTDDIIVSTVRPTRGATALIPQSMDGVICSTGFTIVRAKDGVLPEFFHTVLRLSTTLEQFGRRSSGSSYPAILENDIKETLIPIASTKANPATSARPAPSSNLAA